MTDAVELIEYLITTKDGCLADAMFRWMSLYPLWLDIIEHLCKGHGLAREELLGALVSVSETDGPMQTGAAVRTVVGRAIQVAKRENAIALGVEHIIISVIEDLVGCPDRRLNQLAKSCAHDIHQSIVSDQPDILKEFGRIKCGDEDALLSVLSRLRQSFEILAQVYVDQGLAVDTKDLLHPLFQRKVIKAAADTFEGSTVSDLQDHVESIMDEHFDSIVHYGKQEDVD